MIPEISKQWKHWELVELDILQDGCHFWYQVDCVRVL